MLQFCTCIRRSRLFVVFVMVCYVNQWCIAILVVFAFKTYFYASKESIFIYSEFLTAINFINVSSAYFMLMSC